MSRKLIHDLEAVVEVSAGTPSRIGRLNIGLPIRAKELQAPIEQKEDILEGLRKQRNIFLASNQDVLLPLLPDGHRIYGFLGRADTSLQVDISTQGVSRVDIQRKKVI